MGSLVNSTRHLGKKYTNSVQCLLEDRSRERLFLEEPLKFLSLLRRPPSWVWLCRPSSRRVAQARRLRLPLPWAVRHRRCPPRLSRRLFRSGPAPFRGPPPPSSSPRWLCSPGPPGKPLAAAAVAVVASSTRCRPRRRPSAGPSREPTVASGHGRRRQARGRPGARTGLRRRRRPMYSGTRPCSACATGSG